LCYRYRKPDAEQDKPELHHAPLSPQLGPDCVPPGDDVAESYEAGHHNAVTRDALNLSEE
jgi:hypothetical protein